VKGILIVVGTILIIDWWELALQLNREGNMFLFDFLGLCGPLILQVWS
jgi:hypothetical protein